MDLDHHVAAAIEWLLHIQLSKKQPNEFFMTTKQDYIATMNVSHSITLSSIFFSTTLLTSLQSFSMW
jgi:isocitrate dehydrogenase kinase/phosphatase